MRRATKTVKNDEELLGLCDELEVLILAVTTQAEQRPVTKFDLEQLRQATESGIAVLRRGRQLARQGFFHAPREEVLELAFELDEARRRLQDVSQRIAARSS